MAGQARKKADCVTRNAEASSSAATQGIREHGEVKFFLSHLGCIIVTTLDAEFPRFPRHALNNRKAAVCFISSCQFFT